MIITFPGYAGTSSLANFPVLVQLNTDINGFSYGDFLSGDNDIRFTDIGGTELSYEIDTWNPSGTSMLWVKVPEFQAGTVAKMYYGKSGDTAPACTTDGSTWANGFRTVWHMNATSAPDSTGHGHSGSVQGTVTTTASSQIGTAGDFTGGGWINVAGSADFTFTGDFTWSAWVYAPAANDHHFLGNSRRAPSRASR